MGTCHQLLIVTGCFVGTALGIPWAGEWRMLSWAGLPAPALLTILTLRLPQSPRWLVGQARLDDARRSLRTLRGARARCIDDEIAELQSMSEPNQKTGAPADVALARKCLLITGTLMIFQQFSGVCGVLYYAGGILKDAGIRDANVGAMLAQLVQLAFTGVAVLLVDRLGRKPLLLISNTILAVSTTVLGLYFYVHDDAHTSHFHDPLPKTVALAFVLIFFGGFALGMGALPWLLMAEISPAQYSGLISSGTTMINWLGAFIVTESFTSMTGTLSTGGTFWFYAAVLHGSLIFISVAIPETKGQSLQNIERYFKGTCKLPPPNPQDMTLVKVVALLCYVALTALVGYQMSSFTAHPNATLAGLAADTFGPAAPRGMGWA